MNGCSPPAARWLLLFAAQAQLACDPAAPPEPAVEQPAPPIQPHPLAQAASGREMPSATTQSGGQAALDTQEVAPCPADMVLVEGLFCPKAEQRCQLMDPNSGRSTARCLRFEEPSTCLSDTRELLRFCIDRYEWPNERGVKPRVLVSWTEAGKLCEARGKRLCTASEWLFACEGEQMLPYTQGFERDPTACVIDRFYIPPQGGYRRWEDCQADKDCQEAFARIDQREPAGHFERCKSPFGVYDMNGNANEWVEIPDERYPRRSGIKGGWWGPVRNRCRPTVRFHKEDDWGYEVGFRCCQASQP